MEFSTECMTPIWRIGICSTKSGCYLHVQHYTLQTKIINSLRLDLYAQLMLQLAHFDFNDAWHRSRRIVGVGGWMGVLIAHCEL
jgi:hypothetical protein